MAMQQYCLRWNNHQPNFISVFSSLLNNESLVDVTLAAEGRHLQAHKVVLSACSTYFQSLFTINPCQHPIVILKDVKFVDLKVMVDFMYYGEVNVSHDQLPHILKTAEMLKIKGLAEIPVEQSALSKSQSSSTERAELLTPGESNWSSDEVQRQSLSPSPCPLSPSGKRRRLRKTSTGSGSGSADRTSEDHVTTDCATVPSPIVTTVIKPDPITYVGDNSNPLHPKQQSNESELQKVSSHENMEGEPTHQIALQVPQQDVSHKPETPMDIAGPSSVPQTTSSGYQWGIVDGSYPRFTLSTCQSHIPVSTDMNYTTATLPHSTMENNLTSLNDPTTSTINPAHLGSASSQLVQKRKRSINPQSDEKFVRALEAVRIGGIGFCKAAKLYGVNNRTLWLEYKKRGYPNNRISIKNRKQEFLDPASIKDNPTSPIATTSDQENDVICSGVNQQNTTLANENYIDNRHVDLSPILTRPRYLDMVNVNTQHTLGFPGVSFEQI